MRGRFSINYFQIRANQSLDVFSFEPKIERHTLKQIIEGARSEVFTGFSGNMGILDFNNDDFLRCVELMRKARQGSPYLYLIHDEAKFSFSARFSCQMKYWFMFKDEMMLPIETLEEIMNGAFQIAVVWTAQFVMSGTKLTWHQCLEHYFWDNIWNVLGKPLIAIGDFSKHWPKFMGATQFVHDTSALAKIMQADPDSEFTGLMSRVSVSYPIYPLFTVADVCGFIKTSSAGTQVNEIVDWAVYRYHDKNFSWTDEDYREILKAFFERVAKRDLFAKRSDLSLRDVLEKGFELLQEFEYAYGKKKDDPSKALPIWVMDWMATKNQKRQLDKADPVGEISQAINEAFEALWPEESINTSARLSERFITIQPSFFFREKLHRYFIENTPRRTRQSEARELQQIGYTEYIEEKDQTALNFLGEGIDNAYGGQEFIVEGKKYFLMQRMIDEVNVRLRKKGFRTQKEGGFISESQVRNVFREWEKEGRLRVHRNIVGVPRPDAHDRADDLIVSGSKHPVYGYPADEDVLEDLAWGAIGVAELAAAVRKAPRTINDLVRRNGWKDLKPYEKNQKVFRWYTGLDLLKSEMPEFQNKGLEWLTEFAPLLGGHKGKIQGFLKHHDTEIRTKAADLLERMEEAKSANRFD